MRRLFAIIILGGLAACGAVRGHALSLALDSIATWGKFPRFCINTYRWGDKFFNSYDSLYVVGPGTKFNVKGTTDSWSNHMTFYIPDNRQIEFISDPATSMGLYLTYLAVSVGYDVNVSRLVGGSKRSRSRYNFGFNCSLLSLELYWEHNDVGTRLTRFGDQKHIDIDFNGVNMYSWGIDLYYFFNHKKYSQSAAFYFGKIQKASQGSFFAGLSTYTQDFDIDFSALPAGMITQLPTWWTDYHYRVRTHNYGFRLGYGYNWVFARGMNMGVSISPVVGMRKGFVNSTTENTSFSLYNHFKLSVVWNRKKWFAGLIGTVDSAVISDRESMFIQSNISVQTAVGYRFNLW